MKSLFKNILVLAALVSLTGMSALAVENSAAKNGCNKVAETTVKALRDYQADQVASSGTQAPAPVIQAD